MIVNPVNPISMEFFGGLPEPPWSVSPPAGSSALGPLGPLPLQIAGVPAVVLEWDSIEDSHGAAIR